eukprot:Gregarina_sp_Pseudo_9__3597@NODE_3759_length_565_cov_89_804183_g3442_i0_p1_GENE_NODE_3759_length_565_cov_89_804183_g3442_i0NODE_3759_length_565_cov_89_804183_g3442_i0_p1_ORF_typecomplete_len121_score6_74_NODE_3759_length_565_cov_89_804183_g3442_i0130492
MPLAPSLARPLRLNARSLFVYRPFRPQLARYESQTSTNCNNKATGATAPGSKPSSGCLTEEGHQPVDGLVRDKPAVAFPEIPLAYYRSQPQAMHSIQHRMFYVNWWAVAIALELLREILD